MKPDKDHCKHCDLNPCKRVECHRKAVFYGKKIVMEEPSVYDRFRNSERKREYYSVPLRKNEC